MGVDGEFFMRCLDAQESVEWCAGDWWRAGHDAGVSHVPLGCRAIFCCNQEMTNLFCFFVLSLLPDCRDLYCANHAETPPTPPVQVTPGQRSCAKSTVRPKARERRRNHRSSSSFSNWAASLKTPWTSV